MKKFEGSQEHIILAVTETNHNHKVETGSEQLDNSLFSSCWIQSVHFLSTLRYAETVLSQLK